MADRELERVMTDAEAMMWRLEQDPYLCSNVAIVAVLDRSPDIDVLRRRMERASYLIPRLRHRVRTVTGNLAPPVFEIDPDFDFDSHFRHIALPPPGSDRQLHDLAAVMALDPLDARRPLWQATVVDGLKKGRAAIILKTHHTVTDGEGGMQLAVHLVDLERHADQPAMPDPDEVAAAEATQEQSGDSMRDVLDQTLRIPLGVTAQVRELLADPARLPDASAEAADTLRGLVEQLGDTETARSPIWTERSLARRFLTGQAPIKPTRAVAKSLGGTLNTAFLTIAAETASRYHVAMDAPADTLRASMAVSTRTEQSGSNAFSLVRLVAPTAAMPIDERFRAIQAATAEATEQAAQGAMEAIAALSVLLPTRLITRLARQQTQTVDFGTSNVKGSPIPIYAGGAKVIGTYPIGPTIGTSFNLTLLSYRKKLEMGLNVDSKAVADPDLLGQLLGDSVRDFVALDD
jgi:WS/DGAT/MGAT family acyltransferase